MRLAVWTSSSSDTSQPSAFQLSPGRIYIRKLKWRRNWCYLQPIWGVIARPLSFACTPIANNAAAAVAKLNPFENAIFPSSNYSSSRSTAKSRYNKKQELPLFIPHHLNVQPLKICRHPSTKRLKSNQFRTLVLPRCPPGEARTTQKRSSHDFTES